MLEGLKNKARHCAEPPPPMRDRSRKTPSHNLPVDMAGKKWKDEVFLYSTKEQGHLTTQLRVNCIPQFL